MTAPVEAQRQSSDPGRHIPVRRISFEEAIGSVERDFLADGDVVLSHLLASLSGLFPDGEDMFVESVRFYRDRITDPDLLRQVNAFIGQEAMHGREHRRLNARLGELGYRSKAVEDSFLSKGVIPAPVRTFVQLASRVGLLPKLPERRAEGEDGPGRNPEFMLAMTAALEHWTATMANTFLREESLHGALTDDEFLRFWAWHAIEENEHRAVAFDVYKAIDGDEETRLRAMRLAGLALMFVAGFNTVLGVLSDSRSYRNFRLFRSLLRLRSNPFLSSEFRAALGDYNRPDFHPLQSDTSGLDAWQVWVDGDGPRPSTV